MLCRWQELPFIGTRPAEGTGSCIASRKNGVSKCWFSHAKSMMPSSLDRALSWKFWKFGVELCASALRLLVESPWFVQSLSSIRRRPAAGNATGACASRCCSRPQKCQRAIPPLMLSASPDRRLARHTVDDSRFLDELKDTSSHERTVAEFPKSRFQQTQMQATVSTRGDIAHWSWIRWRKRSAFNSFQELLSRESAELVSRATPPARRVENVLWRFLVELDHLLLLVSPVFRGLR